MPSSRRFPVAAVFLLLAACKPTEPPAQPAAPAPATTAVGPAVATAPVGDPAAPPPLTPAEEDATTTYTYQCGDLTVTANFHGAGNADITFNGRNLSLPQVPAGSGAKYADADGNVFWGKGDAEAVLTLKGEAMRNCIRPAAAANGAVPPS